MSSGNISYSRNRHGYRAMLAAYKAAAFTQLRHNDLIDIQIIQADRSGYDIHDGIHSSHLMEMHFFCGYSVSRGFRFRQYLKNTVCNFFRPVRYLCMADNMKDFFESPVLMGMMMFLFPMDMGNFRCRMTMGMSMLRCIMVVEMNMLFHYMVMGMSLHTMVMTVSMPLFPMDMIVSMPLFPMDMIVSMSLFLMVMAMNMPLRPMPMSMAVFQSRILWCFLPMQILHIMIMVLMRLIQHNIKVTDIQP